MTGGNNLDKHIIRAVLDGNHNEFNQLINKYYNELFVFIYNQTNNVETTKDVLQEIFMRLFEKLHTYNPDKASFRTWMYRVSSNYVLNYLRKEKFELKDYDFNLISSSEDIIASCIKQDDVSFILDVMKKTLNKKHYQIMILSFFSNLTPEEIGDSLGVTEKTVRNTVSLSIQKIRSKIGGIVDGL